MLGISLVKSTIHIVLIPKISISILGLVVVMLLYVKNLLF
jgi:hypothetical protein